MRSAGLFDKRLGAAAEGESGFVRSPGVHAGAWLGVEAYVACSCGGHIPLLWGARKQLSGGELLGNSQLSAGGSPDRALTFSSTWRSSQYTEGSLCEALPNCFGLGG